MIDLVETLQRAPTFVTNTSELSQGLGMVHRRVVAVLDLLREDHPKLNTRAVSTTNRMGNQYLTYDLTELTHAMLITRLRTESGKQMMFDLLSRTFTN